MAPFDKRESIIKRVSGIGSFFTVALIFFTLVNLVMLMIFETRYDRFVSDVEQLTALKPVVREQVPGEMWEVIAGRKTAFECRASAMLDQVSQTLAQNNSAGAQTRVLVLQRTLDTMRDYVSQIEGNMITGVSVDKSQELLTELRDVGGLVHEMLEEYISERVQTEGLRNRRARAIFIFSCGLELIMWIVITVLSHMANRRTVDYIQKQINQLEGFAGRVASGDMEARAPELPSEEFESLTLSLNVMAERLGNLMEQNRLEQENLKKSELRMLQAQINPHFLYNTLDAIMWQAEAGHMDEVVRITLALSNFFRISLSAGEDWITMEQERAHLEGYLSIQKVRYRDILNYEIDIDESIKDEIVLKLLLQPLVENALYHGIKLKRGGGTITVRGWREGKELCFSVHDTGVGMTPERLEEIRAALRSNDTRIRSEDSHGSGFGLKNVDLRIRLYYNQPVGLRIDSDSAGTTVSYRVPAGMKGKSHV